MLRASLLILMCSSFAAFADSPEARITIPFENVADDDFVKFFANTTVDTLGDASLARDISSRDITVVDRKLQITEEIVFDDGQDTFLVYGEIQDSETNPKAFIPVQKFERSKLKGRPGFIEFEISLAKSKSDAFSMSFPFVKRQDVGAINEGSYAAVLLAVRHILDLGYIANDDQWDRVAGFFKDNAIFVRQGSEANIDDVLSYLEVYDQHSNADRFPHVYAHFLRALLEKGDALDRMFLSRNQTIEKYIHNTLKRLFREQMPFTFRNANLALSDYLRRKENWACIALATEVYAGFNSDFISGLKKSNYARDVAIASLIEGVACRAAALSSTGTNTLLELSEEEQKKALQEFMKAYVSLVRRLEERDLISFTSRSREKTVTKAFVEFEDELQGFDG